MSTIRQEDTVVSDPFQAIIEAHSRNAEEYSYPTLVKVRENVGRIYVLELEELFKAIKEDKELLITGVDGLKMLKVMKGAFESSRREEPVTLT